MPINLPIINTNFNLTFKQLNTLPIISTITKFLIDSDPLLYLQNDYDNGLFYAPNNLINEFIQQSDKAKCMANSKYILPINQRSCIQEILNVSPFHLPIATQKVHQRKLGQVIIRQLIILDFFQCDGGRRD